MFTRSLGGAVDLTFRRPGVLHAYRADGTMNYDCNTVVTDEADLGPVIGFASGMATGTSASLTSWAAGTVCHQAVDVADRPAGGAGSAVSLRLLNQQHHRPSHYQETGTHRSTEWRRHLSDTVDHSPPRPEPR
jgi:hypothetical protein